MAPVIAHVDIPDLKFSSLELDARSTADESLPVTSAIKRDILGNLENNPFLPRNDDVTPILSPMATYKTLTARDTKPTETPKNPGAGSIDPDKFNMPGFQALFALIGASFVLGIIWFFFWAKNGGFKWQKGDWDEYKSTVLRRKGPNGTTLSNATKSTKLGGGSVVGDGYSDKDSNSRIGDDTATEGFTETMTVMSSEAPIIKEKQSAGKRETAKERKLREQRQAEWEGGHDNDVRAYRHERAARVGGLNKESDATPYGTNYSATDRSTSDMHSSSNRPSRQASPDKRQSQPRRDFSYTQEESFAAPPPPPAHGSTPTPRPARYQNRSPQRPGASAGIRQVPGSVHIPGSFVEPLDFDNQSVQNSNTKSYHHPIPGLSGTPKAGYRRDRRDSLDD
jgi:hypothetical protein